MNYMIMPGIKKAKIGFKTMPKKKVLQYIKEKKNFIEKILRKFEKNIKKKEKTKNKG